MDLEQPAVTNDNTNQGEDEIDPKELYDYLVAEEPKTNQIYLEILASLVMTPSPIENPEENLLATYTKYLKKLLTKNYAFLTPKEFKTHLETLCNLGFVEILNSDSSENETSILDIIQTYILQANHVHSVQAVGFYLEFLEAGILETYATEQAVNNTSDLSSVFQRTDKIRIINKIGDLLSEYSTTTATQNLNILARKIIANLYVPNGYNSALSEVLASATSSKNLSP
jgi:hypothetical protein